MGKSAIKIFYKNIKRLYLEMKKKPADLSIYFPENTEIKTLADNTDDYRKLNKMFGGDLGWVYRQK